MAGVWEDANAGVRQVLSEDLAVDGRDHRVVVPVGDEEWLGDAGQPREPAGIGDPPLDDGVVLCAGDFEPGCLVAVDLPGGEVAGLAPGLGCLVGERVLPGGPGSVVAGPLPDLEVGERTQMAPRGPVRKASTSRFGSVLRAVTLLRRARRVLVAALR